MIRRNILATAIAIVAAGIGATAIAQQDLPPAVEARQGQFKIMGLNIGVLANMARGNTDYDADQAQIAADNLVAISNLDQSFHWPEGTDNASLEGTRALPAIWENIPDVVSKWNDYGMAAEQFATVAGGGLDAMRGGIGSLGGTCNACHDLYQAEE